MPAIYGSSQLKDNRKHTFGIHPTLSATIKKNSLIRYTAFLGYKKSYEVYN